MVLYGRKTAFNVQKVMWLLEELNIEYEHIELGGDFGGLSSNDFLEKNVHGTIPVLDDNRYYIWESHSILRYISAKYGSETWFSNDPYKRSEYERWMDWAQAKFQPIFMNIFWGHYRQHESKRDLLFIHDNILKIRSCLDTLNSVIGNNDFLLGDNISLADICVGSALYRLSNIGLDIKIPKNVKHWYSQLQIRDSYRKSIMSDFSSLKGKNSF